MDNQVNQTAKIVLLSILFTLLVSVSLLYLFRGSLMSYLQSELSSSSAEIGKSISDSEQIVKTVKAVNDAVVSVVVTKDVPVYERYYEPFAPGGLFGGLGITKIREKGTEEREVGGGSGFIVSVDGLIVTNRHVVEDESARYSVMLNDGTSYETVVLARDDEFDIAILKIDEPLQSALVPISFAKSESVRLGETVIAIGNALGEFRNSVSVGVVSGLSRTIVASNNFGKTEKLDHVIQTDAAINPGNSGGPLLNIYGKVIGVNVATSKGADNIGFALPADEVKSIVDSVTKYGKIVRPSIGVRYVMITEQMVRLNNLPVTYGALLVSGDGAVEPAVLPDSPAAAAGLIEGDVILSVEGVDLKDVDLAMMLRQMSTEGDVKLEVLRGEEKFTVVLKPVVQ